MSRLAFDTYAEESKSMNGQIHIRLGPFHIVALVDFLCQLENLVGSIQDAIEDFKAFEFFFACVEHESMNIFLGNRLNALSLLHLQHDFTVYPNKFIDIRCRI